MSCLRQQHGCVDGTRARLAERKCRSLGEHAGFMSFCLVRLWCERRETGASKECVCRKACMAPLASLAVSGGRVEERHIGVSAMQGPARCLFG